MPDEVIAYTGRYQRWGNQQQGSSGVEAKEPKKQAKLDVKAAKGTTNYN